MGRVFYCVTILLVATACASKPADGQEVVESTVYETIEDTNPIVCRKIVPTGSHFPKRFCARKEVWDDITARSKAFADALSAPGPAPLSTGP